MDDAKPASSGRVYLLVARCHYYFLRKTTGAAAIATLKLARYTAPYWPPLLVRLG